MVTFTDILVQELKRQNKPVSIKDLSRKLGKSKTRIQDAVSSIMRPDNKKWRSKHMEIVAQREGHYGNILYQITDKNSSLFVIKSNMDYQKKRCLHHIKRETSLSLVSMSLKEEASSKKELINQLMAHKNEVEAKLQEFDTIHKAVVQQIINAI